MKKYLSLLLASSLSVILAGCGGTKEEPKENSSKEAVSSSEQKSGEEGNTYKAIDANTSAELWVMTWSGDGQDHKDIGNNPLPEDEVTALNVGMLQGIAKAFNKKYPNIKINLHTQVDDPASGGTSWTEKIINFKETHGQYPDVWASFNIIEDLNKGIVADLSVFENDPDYQKLNPDLMNLMNYYGFQAGLPQYAIPWGVYVNRELANSKNIASPAVDWSWDEFTSFVGKAESMCKIGEVCGAYDASMMFPRGAFIERQLQTTEKGSEYKVDFATNEFLEAIELLPQQSKASALGALSGIVDSDEAAAAYMNKGGYWGYNYFKDNQLLTYDGDPWMLFESVKKGSTNYVNSNDWDIYPRPAFLDKDGEVIIDNHVGVCLDPMGLYNHALDDNNPELSEAEYDKLNIAWTFAKYWIGDTEAWEAKANSHYRALNSTTNEYYDCPAINDTFPVIRQGEDFDRQMEILYSTENHSPYADTNKFKGFAKVVELWGNGNIYGISDKAFPRYYHLDGDSTNYSILEKIDGYGSEDLVGVAINDPAWYSTYSALLKSINREVNGWYNKAFAEVKQTLVTYYGWEF